MNGARATAETNVAILVRQTIEGVAVDLTSYGRFLDRLERRDGDWRIVERATLYEKDRLDPVEPSAAFDALMAKSDAAKYPAPYRYMAYRVHAAGRALAEPVHYDGRAGDRGAQAPLRGLAEGNKWGFSRGARARIVDARGASAAAMELDLVVRCVCKAAVGWRARARRKNAGLHSLRRYQLARRGTRHATAPCCRWRGSSTKGTHHVRLTVLDTWRRGLRMVADG